MKNEDQHIDNLFQKLKSDSFVAPESFMNDLKLRLDAKQKAGKRRRFIFWFFSVALVLIGLAGILFYLSRTPSNNDFNQKSAEHENVSIKNNETIEIDKLKQKKELIGDRNSKSPILQNNQKIVSSGSNSGLNEEFISEKKEKAVKIDLQMNKKKSEFSDSQNSANKKGSKIENKWIPKKNQQIADANSQKISSKENTIDSPVSNSEGVNANQPIAENNVKKINKLNEENNVKKVANGKTSEDVIIAKSDEYIEVPIMKLKNPKFETSPLSLDKNATIFPELPVKEVITLKKKFEVDLQAYGGVLLTSTSFNPNINADGFIYSQLVSPSFGLKTNVFYKNINASLGIESFKTGDNIDFTYTTLVKVGADSVFLYVQTDSIWIDSNFILIDYDVYDVTTYYDTIRANDQIKNSYSWLSIPISFGYRFKFNSWDVIPNVGMNFNFGIANNKGQYPTSNNAKVNYDAVKFNMDIRIQTEVRKNFGKYYVFVSPYFRMHLQPIISSPSLRLSQNNFGINLGAGIKF